MLLLAHPELAPREVPAPPALVALVVFALVLAIARRGTPPRGSGRANLAADPVVAPLVGPLSRAGAAARIGGAAVLLTGVVAGLLGPDDQLRNLAPALFVGFGWPLLLALSAGVGGVWSRINPFDGLARVVAPLGAGDGVVRDDVRPAAAAAALWVWYLTVPATSLDPHNVATFFGLYTLVTLAGCLAFGRVAWLSSTEVFTLLFGWITRARRGGLVGWQAPRGARLVLAVLLGGLLAGQLRDTHLYDPLRTATWGWLWHTVALVAVVLVVLALLRSAERGRGRPGVETAATVWLVPALGLALALARNRVLTSAQVLPGLLSDPFGWGWDVWGTAGAIVVDPSPLSEAGRVWTQVGLLALGGVAAAVVTARAGDDHAPPGGPATTAGLIVWAAVIAFMTI